MLTIPEIDEIAKRATERIAKDFAESGFANPPVVTHGIARAVIEAAEQYMHLIGGTLPASEPFITPSTGSGIEYLKRQPASK